MSIVFSKKIFQNSYKTTNKFLDEVSKCPEIHVVLKDFAYALDVIVCVYTCQHKCTVHDKHREEHHLNRKNIDLKIQKEIPLKYCSEEDY